MKKIVYILIIVAILYNAVSSVAAGYSITITDIQINSKSIEDYDKIFIADVDSIKFGYILNQNEKTSVSPFLYKLVLKSDGEKSERTAGLKEVLYSNLKEGEYIFDVSAFDLAGKWKSSHSSIKFEVNNNVADLMKRIDTLELSKIVADSTISTLQDSIIADGNKKKSSEAIVYIAVGAVSVLLILFVLFLIKDRKKLKNIGLLKNREEEYLKEIASLQNLLKLSCDKEEVEKLKHKIETINKKLENISELNESFNNDVTAVQDKVGELSDLQTKKNSFFSEIIRGITNPTDTIKGLVELLRSYDFNAMESNDIVNNIIDYAHKIIDNAEDIQRIVEFEDNKVEVHLDTLSIASIIDAAVNKNIMDAKRKNIELKTNIATGIEKIQADQHKLIVIMHNLINNAIKFTNENGTININISQKDDSVYFEISDNGIGIEQDELQKIYNNLSDKYNSDVPIGPDSTIGLLTIKKYVNAHGGKVNVSSMINKGSTFSFNIPIR